MTVTEMRCPFPPCSGSWWTKEIMVPMHALNSDFTIGGQPACPASSAMYISVANRRNIDDLTPATRGDVLRAWRKYQEAEADQRRRNAVMPTDPASNFLGFPLGRREHGVDDKAFPGRPADSEEMGPQPGDKPRWKPPMDMLTGESGPLGRAAMDSAHSTTQALLLLTVSKTGEAVASSAKLGKLVDILDGVTNELAAHMEAAMALCTATVGLGDNAPDGATDMANALMDARGRASVIEGGPVIAAVTGLNLAVVELQQDLARALEAAGRYSTALGGGAS